MKLLKVNLVGVPAEWELGTTEILTELGILRDPDGTTVTVARGKGLSVVAEGEEIRLIADRPTDYLRALTHLKAKLTGGADVTECARTTTLCLMEDMSRNSVMHVEGVKRLIRTLALMGYDSLMLYTEETYEIKEYPYFGYMRGRYTMEEMREIDDYAYALGIEIIPCIQTLAHLKQALNWEAFKPMHDIDDIMLVGEEKTYAFIDAMLRTMSEAFRSRRINIGMDEAHNLGRGVYRDRNGARPTHEVILEHLDRVISLCKKYGYAPMMWSDMFFRMAFNGKYYVKEGEIPPEVAAKIPRDVTLIYWDYYTNDRDLFRNMVHCHTKLDGVPVAFAGGAWRWGTFSPMNRLSLKSTKMQLAECYASGINDMIVTAWGDNGNESSHFCTLPTLLYFAEAAYRESAPTEEVLEARARVCFDIGFEDLLTLDAPSEMWGPDNGREVPTNPCKHLLYNDPLLGLLDLHMEADRVMEVYTSAEVRLRAFAGHEKWGYIFENLANLSDLLALKANYSNRLRAAYLADDRDTLAALADEVPLMVERLDRFYASHLAQWQRESKPFGFEVQEQRLGGLRLRLLSAEARVRAYLAGEVTEIAELLEERLPFRASKPGAEPYVFTSNWGRIVTPSIYT